MSVVAISNKQDKKEELKRSDYYPSEDIRDVLSRIQRDFGVGKGIMNRTYEEFNDKSLIERMNVDQRRFNSYVAGRSDDPDEVWKSNTVRPVTRNKIISTAAHVTNRILFPNVFAQDDNDNEDKAAGIVARDLMDWSYDNSKLPYDKCFLYSVIAACFNPASIVYTGYEKAMRKVKNIQTSKEEEIEDDQFTGFMMNNVPLDELYIGNIYESEIQRQPFLIWRRVIDYNTALAKYGNEANFKYVTPGVRIFYSDDEDCFYEQSDDSIEGRQVEEIIYWNRYEDLQTTVVNGVLMGSINQGIKRQDKNYPFSKLIYEPVDEGKFFYGKSLADKIKDDQRVVDVLYNMIIDGSFLQLFPPIINIGEEEVDTSVIVPGSTTTFKNSQSVAPLQLGANLNAGLQAMQKVEESINESAVTPQSTAVGVTAFETAKVEENAKVLLGLFGKMIGFFVKEFGMLRLSDILQYMTLGEVDEVSGKENTLKFKTILLDKKLELERKKTRKIEFDMGLPDDEISEEEAIARDLKILQEETDNDKEIFKINPRLFRKLKFKIKVSPDILTMPSGAIAKAVDLELYDRAINNPVADQEQLFRDFLIEPSKPGQADKYVKKEPTPEEIAAQQAEQAPQGQMTKNLNMPLGQDRKAPMPANYKQD